MAWLLIVGCLPPQYVAWQFRRDNLALRAERVIYLPNTDLTLNWYTWFNNTDILLYKYDGVVGRLNTSTKVTTTFPHASNVMHAAYYASPMFLSPRGDILLAFVHQKRNSPDKLAFIHLDGKSADCWMDMDAYSCAWLDSETFLSLNEDPQKNKSLDKYTIHGVKSRLRNITSVDGPPLLPDNTLVGISHGHAICLSEDWQGKSKTEVILFSANLADNSPTKSHVISLPEKALISDARMSPDGDKIAWLLTTIPQYNPGLLPRLYRKLGLLNKEETAGVWVSNPKGEGFQCLGHLGTPATERSPVTDPLQWTPDGSHLSFYFGNRAYVFRIPN